LHHHEYLGQARDFMEEALRSGENGISQVHS
jgi:hypothetical protein